MSYEATYKLWYEFLKRTDCESWSEKVKQDFAGTHEQDFETWLDSDKRCRMFAQYGPIGDPDARKNHPVRHILKGQGIEDVNLDTHLVLVIDIRKPVSEIMESVERKVQLMTEKWWLDNVWWNEKYEGSKSKVGRTKWEKSKALYPLEKRPDIEALELTLLIHDIDRDHKTNEEWTHWETGVEVKKLDPKFQQNMTYGKTGPDAEQKIQLTAAVTRIIERAEKIKAGVAQGIFPAV